MSQAPIPPLFQPPDDGPKRVTPRRLHRNSRPAYAALDKTGRAADVVHALRGIGRPATDREVCEALRAPDMNFVRPRITGLIDAGYLREVEDVECPVTHRRVRRVWFSEPQESQA